MAHHDSTPQSVLDASRLTPVMVWTANAHETSKKKPGVIFRRSISGAFVGDVERDLLGVSVGTSRKGRKIRRERKA